MKKLFCVLALLCLTPFYGQKRVAQKVESLVALKTDFKRISPLTVNKNASASAGVKQATYATLNSAAVNAISKSKPEFLEVDIPYNDGIITVQLYKANLFAEGFRVATNGQPNVAVNEGAHYRGIIKNDVASVASLSFFDNEISGIISGKGINNLVVGKLKKPGNVSDYIIYSDRQLASSNPFSCHTADVQKFVRKPKSGDVTPFDSDEQKCVTLYFELDYEIFTQNGSSIEATTNWMIGLFNNIQTLYLNDGMNVALHSMFIWSEPDPYSGETSEDYLIQFLQIGQFGADAGQLIGIDEGGLGGLAPLEGLCSDYNMSYVDVVATYQDVPVYSWNVQAMTHEFGHQFGSPHTHACAWNGDFTQIDACGDLGGYPEGDCTSGIVPENQGTIMSYCHLLEEVGISFANGFGPQPSALMSEFINSNACLGTNCTSNFCETTISSLNVSDVTFTGATASWSAESEGLYEHSFSAVSEGFGPWIETTETTYTIAGLLPNTYYDFGVRELCEAGQSAAVTIMFATDADWCAGQIYTDSGNLNGEYGANEYIVRVFKPLNPTQKVKVLFTEFQLEEDYDFLNVYNGSQVHPSNLIGSFTGSEIATSFESTAPDGALTFEFLSDHAFNAEGWEAQVSCTAAVTGLDDMAILGLSYYPNPGKGIINVTAAENIERIIVSNVAGQQLLTKDVNAAETRVDISSFANGIYFFKAVNGSKEANFIIIKQ